MMELSSFSQNSSLAYIPLHADGNHTKKRTSSHEPLYQAW